MIRPKSIATVVVVLFGTFDGSSRPTPAAVMSASVVSGVISETAPTSVVFPTPNPPAITIFAEVIGAAVAASDRRSEPAKSNEYPFQHVNALVDIPRIVRVVEDEQSRRDHVGDEYPGDA